MEWKDVFAAVGALIGLISALVTALGAIAAYKLKKAEKPAVVGAPVKILSLKEQRSLDWNVAVFKIAGYGWIVIGPLWAAVVIWWLDLGTTWIVTIIVGIIVIAALFLFLLSKLRGDLSKRRSRTKYETIISVQAPYDLVFSKCHKCGPAAESQDYLIRFRKWHNRK